MPPTGGAGTRTSMNQAISTVAHGNGSLYFPLLTILRRLLTESKMQPLSQNSGPTPYNPVIETAPNTVFAPIEDMGCCSESVSDLCGCRMLPHMRKMHPYPKRNN